MVNMQYLNNVLRSNKICALCVWANFNFIETDYVRVIAMTK